MKTTFVAAILAAVGAFGTAQARPAGIFDIDRELRRGPRDCSTFMERYAERDTEAEDAFETVITNLSNDGNVVATKMLEMKERKDAVTACIYAECSEGTFEPGDCRPDDDDDGGETRRALRRHGGGGRGGFGGGRRGGIEELCDNLDAANEVLDALIDEFGNPFDIDIENKPARRAIMMLTMGTMTCDEI